MIYSRLFRLRTDLSFEENVICRANGIVPGAVYWLDGERRGNLGSGQFGQFRPTYEHALGTSPTGAPLTNFPMRYFEPIESLSTEN